MSHLDDLSAKRDRKEKELNASVSRRLNFEIRNGMEFCHASLEWKCMVEERERLSKELKAVTNEYVTERMKEFKYKDLQLKEYSGSCPVHNDDDDFRYRGAVQQADRERSERSHQQFHRQFPGLDCERERR